jgi:hypothetical protein
MRPQLIVVIDTEEEFDWNAFPDPKATNVGAIHQIYRVQEVFNEYGIKPCYVVDDPIARNQESVAVLKEFLHNGQCEIGSHLHPWVNPPFEEELSRANMYPGNLSYELEYEKLKNLTHRIHESFGFQPHIYRAGRYGLGRNTFKILNELGYDIDMSICTAFDFRADGGPDYSTSFAAPFWAGEDRNILEIPLSGAFVGAAGSLSRYLYKAMGLASRAKAHGVLSRLSIVDRLLLSPEGFTTVEHKKLTGHLLQRGFRVFSWNFHSTTMKAGKTAYTQSEKDIVQFLDSFKRYFDYFFEQINGQATTPTLLKKQQDDLMA